MSRFAGATRGRRGVNRHGRFAGTLLVKRFIPFLACAGAFMWPLSPEGMTIANAFTVPGPPEAGDPNRPLFAVLKAHFVPGLRRDVMAITFRPDGRMLATGDDAGMIKIWALPGCEDRSTLRVPDLEGGIHRLAFSPNGKVLASASSTNDKVAPDCKAMTLWDVASLKPRSVGDRLGHVYCLAFNPDGKTLAIGHAPNITEFLPGTLSLWDLAAKRVAARFVLPDARICSVAFAPDGKRLAVLDHTGWIRLLSPVTCAETKRFQVHGQAPRQIGFAPDGESLFSTAYYSALPFLELWEVRTGKRKAVLEPQEGGNKAVCAAFLSNAPILAVGTISGVVELRNARTLDLLAQVEAHEKLSSGVYAIAASKDGKLIATGGGDGLVKLWNVQALLKQWPQTNPKRK